jgi:hypothetical protein
MMMSNNEVHLSDAELLRMADGEASALEKSRMEAHLTACWQCRSRHTVLDRSISNYMEVHDRLIELTPIDESRAQLLVQLIDRAAARPAPVPRSSWISHRLAYAGAALSLILALGIVLYFRVQRMDAAWIPDGRLTPGVTRGATKEDLCSSAPLGFYPIPADLASRVFEKYRIQNPRPRSYEVDYLITPGLGGADDIRNLWPQPYGVGEWNAHVKDALEDHLHDLVCVDGLDLATAQHDIATNWIEAYRKYFKTDHPLPDHIAFVLDPAWEN